MMPHIPSMDTAARVDRPMSAPQKWLIVGIAMAIVALGIMVVIRSAFLKRRMTDFGDYQRAAWAIRTGADPYSVTCDNGWHYNYPPLLAIVMAPFADAPPDGRPVAALPYAVSVGAWYAIGVLAMLVAVHLLACAVEWSMRIRRPRFGYDWWAMRLGPLLISLPAAGRTLGRGQVNTIVLALLAGWIWSVVRGRRVTGGVLLALAICIKVIPAFLLLHPLWRRDGRALAGSVVGLVLGLAAVPMSVCGPAAATAQATTYLRVTLAPGLGLGGDYSRSEELTNANTTDSQSIMSVLHNLSHTDSWARPARFATWAKAAHWLTAGVLVCLTLMTAGRRPAAPCGDLLFTGSLCVVMVVVSPVCHLHYFLFVTPLLAVLWPRPRGTLAMALFFGVQVLSLFPITMPGSHAMPFREFGATTLTALAAWAVGLREIGRNARELKPTQPAQVSNRAA
jgi:hypothetical protein